MTSSKWFLSSGDASGIPALYVRKLDSSTYAVCEVNRWEDLDSSAVATHGKYNVQSGTVNLLDDQAADALRSCGWKVEARTGNIVSEHDGSVVAEFDTKAWPFVVVEALWGYGRKDVACDVSGNNLRKLMSEAKGAV